MFNKSSYNPNIHHRRSIRLKGCDYSQAGLYFITICCYDRACLFGEIVVSKNQSTNDNAAQMILNDAGKIAHECWLEIPNHFPNVVLHEFVVMPNHIHGIIEFVVGANNHSPNIIGAKDVSPNNEISKDVSPNIERSNNYTVNVETNENISPNAETNKTNTIQNELNENYATNNEMYKIDTLNNLRSLDVAGARIISQNTNSNRIGSLDDVGAKIISPLRSPSKTIGSVVRGFKIGVTKWVRQNTNVYDVWQRNYHEHIIRNDPSYQKISNYIINNPAKWADDKFYKKG
jgi:putative transposase